MLKLVKKLEFSSVADKICYYRMELNFETSFSELLS